MNPNLTPEQRSVMFEQGTEPPFTGQYVNHKGEGIYTCANCQQELFASTTKFDSGTGWPSFTDPVNVKNVELKPDVSHGQMRTEVRCKNCGAHLGHVFPDGPNTCDRYCINSVALDFKPNK